jgi:microcystin-dependent protein
MRRVYGLAAAVALSGLLVLPQVARAQSDPFLGQLMLVGFTFCPRGWAPAEGQILSIAQNTALFSLLGTTYGGNGQTTFALPDLRGRVPISQGQGPGLSPYTQGEESGTEFQTLTINQMPAHTHQAYGSGNSPVALGPSNFEVATQDRVRMYAPPGAEVAMAPQMIGMAGGSQPFDNRSPYLALQWCIALTGVFPPRN